MAHSQPYFDLRAQLRNYSGKQATFSVQINIHELANVPFLSDDFACKWSVERAQAHASTPPIDSTMAHKRRANGSEFQPTFLAPLLGPTAAPITWNPPSKSSDYKALKMSLLQPSRPPNPDDHGSDSEDDHPPSTHYSVAPTDCSHAQSDPVLGPGKGTTATVAVAGYAVRWDELVELALNMGVIKETKGLMPSQLKLSVEHVPQLQEQLVKPKTALGMVRINLAEYVGRGPITRRYLLRDGKTNATLKLTIEVKWLSGEQDYIVPPLPKAQIMESMASLRPLDRVLPPTSVRTPTRPITSFTESPSSSYVDVSTPNLSPTRGVNRGRPTSLFRSPTLSHPLSFIQPTAPDPAAGTEEIIEALFNPIPTTNLNPGPFAYYAPPKLPVRKGMVNISTGLSELDSNRPIVRARRAALAQAVS